MNPIHFKELQYPLHYGPYQMFITLKSNTWKISVVLTYFFFMEQKLVQFQFKYKFSFL